MKMLKMIASPCHQGCGCCLPLDAECSAVKKGDKQESRKHPKLDNVGMQEKKMGVHKVAIKDGGKNNRQRMLSELKKRMVEHDFLRSRDKKTLHISDLCILICS